MHRKDGFASIALVMVLLGVVWLLSLAYFRSAGSLAHQEVNFATEEQFLLVGKSEIAESFHRIVTGVNIPRPPLKKGQQAYPDGNPDLYRDFRDLPAGVMQYFTLEPGVGRRTFSAGRTRVQWVLCAFRLDDPEEMVSQVTHFPISIN